MSGADRRRFRRVNAPVFCRPSGGLFGQVNRQVRDISAGGVRVYSDDRRKPGEQLVLEFLFADGTTESLRAQVVWVMELPPGAGATYDVGLVYVEPSGQALRRIEQVLAIEQ